MSAPAGNPYIGPRTFQEKERDRFFGREREAAELLALVVSEPLVLYYAQSGAGKSSLVNACLIPDLKEKGFAVISGRVGGESPAGIEVNNIFAFNLMRSLAANDVDSSALTNLLLNEFFTKFHNAALLPALPESSGQAFRRRVLVIDQFEELFSMNPAAWERREGFFQQLVLAMEGDPPLRVLLVTREDYIAALDPYAPLLPNRLRMRYHMQQLEYEAALKAIKEPVQVHEFSRPYAPGVAEKLVDDLRSTRVIKPDGTPDVQPGQFVEPLQLQVICYNLWENLPPGGAQITEKDLLDVGDVNTTLGNYYAARVFAVAQARNIKERKVREWFTEKLISSNGIRNMVLKGPGTTSSGLENDLIEALSDLVRAEQRGGATFYELTHDRLVEPILEDNRNWFNQNLSPLQRQAALWKDQGENESWLLSGRALAEVEQWEKDHQDELTDTEKEFIKASQASQAVIDREQRASQLTRLIAALGIIAIALAVFGYQTSLTAQRQARIALAGQLAILSGSVLEEFPQSSLLLAIEANSVMQPGEQQPASAAEVLRAALKEPHGLPLPGHEQSINTLAFSAHGRWLATGSDDGTVHLLDMQAVGDGTLPRPLMGHSKKINALAFSADDRWLATGSADATILLWDLTAPDPSVNPKVVARHERDINTLAFSPDGHWLATGGQDGSAWLWDLTSSNPGQDPYLLTSADGWIQTLAFSPDGRWLAAGGGGSYIEARLWDISTSEPPTSPRRLPSHTKLISTLAFSADGRWLATGSRDNTAQLWEMNALDQPARVLKGHSDWVNALAFSPNGRWLATGSGDNNVRLWDLNDPNTDAVILVGHTSAIRTLAFNPNGNWLATGGQDHSIRLWDLRAPVPAVNPTILRGHDGWVNALAFNTDGTWLASGAGDGSLRLWDQINADQAVNPSLMRGHGGAVNTLAFHADKNWLISGAEDGSLRRWDMLATGPAARPIELPSHEGWVQVLVLSPQGRWLATASGDGTARLWDLETSDAPNHFFDLRSHAETVTAIAFSEDEQWLATGSADDTVRLWDLTAPDPSASPKNLAGPQGDINALAFSPDGRWLAAGSKESITRLWDLSSADPATGSIELPGHGGWVLTLAFSPDDRWLATGSDDNTARLWDLTTIGTTVSYTELRGHDNQINVLAFSPDSHWLATGSWDGTARLWDMRASSPAANPKVLSGHRDRINALAFSPDGRWLATGSRDKTAHLWDLHNPNVEQTLVVLSGHEGGIKAVAFSSDNRWLATGSEDKTIRLWLVQLDELKSLACRVAGRNFSQNEWAQYFPSTEYNTTCEQWPYGR